MTVAVHAVRPLRTSLPRRPVHLPRVRPSVADMETLIMETPAATSARKPFTP